MLVGSSVGTHSTISSAPFLPVALTVWCHLRSAEGPPQQAPAACTQAGTPCLPAHFGNQFCPTHSCWPTSFPGVTGSSPAPGHPRAHQPRRAVPLSLPFQVFLWLLQID